MEDDTTVLKARIKLTWEALDKARIAKYPMEKQIQIRNYIYTLQDQLVELNIRDGIEPSRRDFSHPERSKVKTSWLKAYYEPDEE